MRFEVAFEVEIPGDVDPKDAANIVSEALDFGEIDHTVVFVSALDDVDGSRVGGWVGEDEDDLLGVEDSEE